MTGSYDPVRVLLSLAISVFASWATLEIVARIALQQRAAKRYAWMTVGAFAMGIGIWSMHYIGMLAYRMQMPVLYDWPTVMLSMLAAVAASRWALEIVSRSTLTWKTTLLGSMFMGSGIAAMHYIGMAAMRMPARVQYSWPLVSLSVLAAMVISVAAIRVGFRARRQVNFWSWSRTGASLLLGFAIPTMHYIGMAAASWKDDPSQFAVDRLRHTVAISELSAIGIVLVTMLLLVLVLALAGVDRLFRRLNDVALGRERENEALVRNNNRLQHAFRAGGVGFWEFDAATGLFYVDDSLREMYDIPWNDAPVTMESWTRCVHPDDLAPSEAKWEACLLNEDKYEDDYRVVLASGAVYVYKSVASIVRNDSGLVERVVGMLWDITGERQKEKETAELAERFRKTLDAIADAVIATDDHHNIVFLNHAACTLTGWSSQEAIGLSLEEVFQTRDAVTDQPRRNPVERCIESNGTFLSEDGILVSRTGGRYNIKKRVSLISTSDSAVITFRDITEAKKMQAELEHAASHDALTRLYNRGAFEKKLHSVWEETKVTGTSNCLCIVDLDRFKIINDTSGHMAGDALLRHVSQTLLASCGPQDFVARMGGDEFMLLLHDINASQGLLCTNRILESLRTDGFEWRGKSYDVSASIGLVDFNSSSPPPEMLISQADVACFTSKHNGRNQVSVYSAGSSQADYNFQEIAVAADIRDALERDHFELHAQPICDLEEAGSATYYELLVRMRNKQGNLIAAADFIPAAERYGLIDLIDRWVIRTALRQCGDADPRLRFAINLSAQSLSDSSLFSFVEEQFRLSSVSPARITFEITESAIIRNLSNAMAFLQNVRDLGCSIALDDFGAGMSSLTYLRQFKLDLIKIDGAFVKKLSANSLDQAIVVAVTEIARAMNARTVAECVEDREALRILHRLKVDFAQGWETGKPMPLNQVIRSERGRSCRLIASKMEHAVA